MTINVTAASNTVIPPPPLIPLSMLSPEEGDQRGSNGEKATMTAMSKLDDQSRQKPKERDNFPSGGGGSTPILQLSKKSSSKPAGGKDKTPRTTANLSSIKQSSSTSSSQS